MSYPHEREALFRFLGSERISGVALIGGDVEPVLDDVGDPTSWTLTASGPAPEGHLVELDPHSGLVVAMELPVAYLDSNRSGALDAGDTPTALACEGDAAAVLWFLPPPRDLETAVNLGSFGVAPGWNALKLVPTKSGEPDLAPLEDPLSLVLDPTACGL